MYASNTDLQAARTALVDILYQRSFLLSVPLAAARERRHASDQRKAERIRQLGWISPEDALYIGGARRDLESALNSGVVACRFYHVSRDHGGRDHGGRWWVWKEAEPREAIRIGTDGRSRVDNEQWALRVHQDDWHAYIEKPAAPAPPGDVPPIVTDTATNPVEPSPPSAELPSQRAAGTPALAAPSTSKRKRAKVAAQFGTYANHVAEHLKRTGEYPSETDDKTWAENNGYVQRHVTTVLRPQYRDGLAEPEQHKFQDVNKGKRRSNKDPGP
jgi:hypothetical protein